MQTEYIWAILGLCSIIVLFGMMFLGERNSKSRDSDGVTEEAHPDARGGDDQ